jgi:farnesyl-diphosphate farnesyltransferase
MAHAGNVTRAPRGTYHNSLDELHARLLQGVSRTFALTIPQLPPELELVVSNAYLLCRIVDTIEDEPALTADQKRDLSARFAASVRGSYPAESFSAALAPLLSDRTIDAEHELIRDAAAVIRTTHSFAREERTAIERCIEVMANGMVEFQCTPGGPGLKDVDTLARYCYHVAGVVGEMLTDLFCHYSPQIERRRHLLMPLAVSFGQGLQMTNIIKDLWDDYERGACWLPRDVFGAVGFDLNDLRPDCERERFQHGLEQLIGIAHDSLNEAMKFVLNIPKQETGIRVFCLWALGMALLTLRKINRRRNFTSSNQVKISRNSVRATYYTLRMTVRSDALLKSLAQLAGSTLPSVDRSNL